MIERCWLTLNTAPTAHRGADMARRRLTERRVLERAFWVRPDRHFRDGTTGGRHGALHVWSTSPMPNEHAHIEVVTVHPPTQARFVSMEHAEGELLHLGDALGVDCTVVRLVNGWVRPYETDGARNEDWYGWREPLLAPLDSIIESVRINDVT